MGSTYTNVSYIILERWPGKFSERRWYLSKVLKEMNVSLYYLKKSVLGKGNKCKGPEARVAGAE